MSSNDTVARNENFSADSTLISPFVVINKAKLQSTIMTTHTLVAQKKTVALFLTHDPANPFHILEAKRAPAKRKMKDEHCNLVGVYGPGLQPGWIMDDLQAMGIIAK